MTTSSTALITPDMRIAGLLDAQPQLEDVLIEIAPALKKLRNPVLRKTVARVATLERAASMAGIPVRDLVLQLRSVVGQPTGQDDPTASPAPTACGCFHPAENEPVGVTISADTETSTGDPPAWFEEGRVCQTIDARAIFAASQVPVGPVVQAAEALGEMEILRVTVDFKPVPMIEMLANKGYRTYCRQLEADRFELFTAAGGGGT
jgi:hypothetical protein